MFTFHAFIRRAQFAIANLVVPGSVVTCQVGMSHATHACETTCSSAAHSVLSHVVSSPEALTPPSVLVVPGLSWHYKCSQGTSRWSASRNCMTTFQMRYTQGCTWADTSSHSPASLCSHRCRRLQVPQERKAVLHPSDWLASPADPPYFGSSTLKVYTEGKVNNFKDGNSSYLKLRDASEDANGNRTGTQKIEFLRTTEAEA